MGAENWALFKLPSDEEGDPARCERCQLSICGYVTGVEQLLQLALWLDRQERFGKTHDTSETIGKIKRHTDELAKKLGELPDAFGTKSPSARKITNRQLL